jgi:hypothetical protein
MFRIWNTEINHNFIKLTHFCINPFCQKWISRIALELFESNKKEKLQVKKCIFNHQLGAEIKCKAGGKLFCDPHTD